MSLLTTISHHLLIYTAIERPKRFVNRTKKIYLQNLSTVFVIADANRLI